MKHKILLVTILLLSLFLRTYRTPDFLGFWYDQGRDALVIWDFLHKGNVFFIGPTTGIEGIFLGPFYYYFIAPFYLLSGGNPVLPALWLAVVSAAAVVVAYFIAKEYFSPPAALFTTLLFGLSYSMATYSRWLSNPTPLPLFSLLAFWIILKLIHGSPRPLLPPLLGLVLGLCLQFEAASAIFFFPATGLILLINRKSLAVGRKSFVYALVLFGLTLVPQLAFNLKNNHLLFKAFDRFLISEKSFQASFTVLLEKRLSDYFNYFFGKLSLADELKPLLATGSVLLAMVAFKTRRLPPKPTTSLVVWILLPLTVLLFYHGNKGYVWDHYFIGVYPQFFLLLAAVWSTACAGRAWAKFIVCLLLAVFLYQNTYEHLAFLSQKYAGYIALTPIIQSVDWVYRDAMSTPFNVDVYVPPVISHSWDYVFLWRGHAVYSYLPSPTLTPRLYTILEPDPGHELLRQGWLQRQNSHARLESEINIGPILVQKRLRRTP